MPPGLAAAAAIVELLIQAIDEIVQGRDREACRQGTTAKCDIPPLLGGSRNLLIFELVPFRTLRVAVASQTAAAIGPQGRRRGCGVPQFPATQPGIYRNQRQDLPPAADRGERSRKKTAEATRQEVARK